MINNILEYKAEKRENALVLHSQGDYFVFETVADSDGYYLFEIGYEHNDWEAYHYVTVTYPDGESVRGRQGFMHGKTKESFTLYLKRGVNKIRFEHLYMLPIQIFYINNLGKAKELPYELSPNNLVFFSDNPKKIQTFVKNYRQAVLRIETEDGAELPFTTKEKGTDEYTLSMKYIFIDGNEILKLKEGIHTLYYHLENGMVLHQRLEIRSSAPITEFKYINLNIGHGNSTLLLLPNGKNLLIDSAIEEQARDKVIPFLEKNKIKVDYFLLTHDHIDHNGMMDEIISKNGIKKPDSEEAAEMVKKSRAERYEYLKKFTYLDSSMLCYYDELHKIWDMGGVKAEALNSCFDEKGNPAGIYKHPFIENNEYNYENATSVSLMIDYNGFRCYHGADNYSYTQERYASDMIKNNRAEELSCHWFYANHHFVYDISPRFINTLNPVGVYVTNRNVYFRHTYKTIYKKEVEGYKFTAKRLSDTLVADDVGTSVVCVNNADDWYYETLADCDMFK